jgi:hypothetical protein
VALDVDGRSRQEIILTAGGEAIEYLRLLGRLRPGPHRLRLHLNRDLSPPEARTVTIHSLRSGSVPDSDPAAFVWQHAPVLHYRALESRLDSLTTDAPVLLFYRPIAGSPGRDGVEYHVVFTHEDAGTNLTGLLARWGHTTDIEWVYRVERDGEGRIVVQEFQGPEHSAVAFQGGRALGGHPVLQVATANGLVSDRVRCPFRAALAPSLAQPPGEPREGVLHRFPWIYRVSALEVARQEPLAADPPPGSTAAADLRRYVFLQWKRAPGSTVPLEAAVMAGGTWYTSGWGRPDLTFGDVDGESTAVRLPLDSGESAVTAIAVRAVEPRDDAIEVRLVRAFFLDQTYRPRRTFAEGGVLRLTADHPRATAWERVGPVRRDARRDTGGSVRRPPVRSRRPRRSRRGSRPGRSGRTRSAG